VTSPKVIRVLRREGRSRRRGPTGEVGLVERNRSFEIVWVRKDQEVIDPDWFSQRVVDCLAVIQGRMRIEFANPRWRPRELGPGDVLVLPPSTRCRAYRWPRSSRRATVFLAIYPTRQRRAPRSQKTRT
jgi:mannose-6-phosphate isomerase-like protein (cupin superfamily)